MGTSKRERQKANRQKRREEDAKSEKRNRLVRTTVQWGVGILAAFLAVVAIFWLTGGFADDDSGAPSPTHELVLEAPLG